MAIIEMGATAAVLAIASTFIMGHEKVLEGACDQLEPFLLSQMVGQNMAIQQFSDAVCDHLSKQHPQKPLVVSAHGSPGVGKSFLPKLAAKALYNREPQLDLECPGMDCAGLKVFSGLDYVSADRSQQHAALKTALVEHVKKHPQALIVIDEYDKMDCSTQFMFQQLIQGSHNAGIAMNRAMVVLESNAGFQELHNLLLEAGDRRKACYHRVQMSLMLVDGDVLNSLLFMNLAPNEPVYARACLALVSRMVVPFEARLHAMCIAISGIRDMAMKSKLNTQDTVKSIMSAEAVQRQLKEVVAAKWDAAGCHDTASLWKMVGLVDFFLPFLPLERPHLHQLFQIRLNATAAALLQSHGANLTWDPAVTTFLCDKVDYDGVYPIEGAKEVSILLTRYVSRTLRQWQLSQKPASKQLVILAKSVGSVIPKSLKGTPPVRHWLHLVPAPHGDGIGLRNRQPPQQQQTRPQLADTSGTSHTHTLL